MTFNVFNLLPREGVQVGSGFIFGSNRIFCPLCPNSWCFIELDFVQNQKFKRLNILIVRPGGLSIRNAIRNGSKSGPTSLSTFRLGGPGIGFFIRMIFLGSSFISEKVLGFSNMT